MNIDKNSINKKSAIKKPFNLKQKTNEPIVIKKETPVSPQDEVKIGGVSQDEAKYFTYGNKIKAYVNGKKDNIFPEINKMLTKATKSVQLEMFEFEREDLADMLIRDAKRGVKVQVILDPTSSNWDPEKFAKKNKLIEKMRKNGVEVVTFPVDSSKKQIDHVKLLIIDGKEVMFGGMNWGEHSYKNHDINFKLEGPGVNYYRRIFNNDWQISGGKSKVDIPMSYEKKGDTPVAGLTTYPNRKGYKYAIYNSLDKAKKSIHLEMFVLTDSGIIKRLIAAKERGLDVRVILDPRKYGDGQFPNGPTAKKLKEAGIQVRWWNAGKKDAQKLHMKMGLIDDDRVIAGSGNWTYKGLNVNHETGGIIVDKNIKSELESMFEYDWKHNTSEQLPPDV